MAAGSRPWQPSDRSPSGRQNRFAGRFAYFYLMKADPDRVRVVAPSHVSYWGEHRLAHYMGGPFKDRTGGLITFDADNTARAQHAVRGDPFLVEVWSERTGLNNGRPTTDPAAISR